MGLFAKVQTAKAAAGANYAKPGKYWVRVSYVKFDKHQVKGQEFIAIETECVHVLENAEGKGPKPGEPISFVYMDGVLGNEARLKSFIMTAVNCQEAEVTAEALQQLTDPAFQPMKDIVLEVFAGPQKTRSGKDIIGARVLRRVWAEEIKASLEQIVPTVRQALLADGKLDKMIQREAAERA